MRTPTLLSALAATTALLLTGCSNNEPDTTTTPLCEQYCDQLQTLDEQRCTQPDVHNCAATLTDKVLLASSIDDTLAASELTDITETVHNKSDAISTYGELFGSNDCFTESYGDTLFDCRQYAQEIDGRFTEMLELVQSPA